MKKVILVIFIVAILIFVGLFVVGKVSQRKQAMPVGEKEAEITEEEERVPFPEEYIHDQDRDGILDTEEEALGTSDTQADTDGDGIPDKYEIEKYGTDPTKEDTDGDGFWDAIEILSGYNPNGEGKLQAE